MYKVASKIKLRITTPKGVLGVEQLWDLSLTDLDKVAIALDEEWKASGKKSYLKVKSTKDKNLKLMKDIVLDILETKVEANERLSNQIDIKKNNQKIEAIIDAKRNQELEGLSIEELEKKLK